jgi:hypothetical protein
MGEVSARGLRLTPGVTQSTRCGASLLDAVVGPTHSATEHVYRTDDAGRTWRILSIS